MNRQIHKLELKLPFDKKVETFEQEEYAAPKKPEIEESKKDISSSTEDSKGGSLEGLGDLENLVSAELAESSDKFLNLLVQTNDRAIAGMNKDNAKDALQILEKIERLLEFAASTGKTLDRNLVIVVLYNIASAYQCNWSLEKCSRYIDGVIYNLQDSFNHETAALEALIAQHAPKEQIQSMKAIRLRKQHFLLKVYLQHCAVLSQLSKHEQALVLIKKASKLLKTIVEEVYDECLQLKTSVEIQMMNLSKSPSQSNLTIACDDYFSISVNDPVFREEINYNRVLIDSAIPFLSEFLKTVGNFSLDNPAESVSNARKSIYNWKNNPENNEKYLRKEFSKDSNSCVLNDNRSLLGVQQASDWLEDFNIGSVMHMKPMKYKDYAKKREFVKEITKEALQENVIYMSLVLFTTATEMRFIEMAQANGGAAGKKNAGSQKNQNLSDTFKQSEAYHLKAIELVCKYINGPCPYVNHLISSYHKHYKQNLETILEESFVSISDTKSLTREVFDADEKSLSKQLDELFARKGDSNDDQFDVILEPSDVKPIMEKKDRANSHNTLDLQNIKHPHSDQPHLVLDSAMNQKPISSSANKPTPFSRMHDSEEGSNENTPRQGKGETARSKEIATKPSKYFVKKEFNTPGRSGSKKAREGGKSEHISHSEITLVSPGYVSERIKSPENLVTHSQELPAKLLKEVGVLKSPKEEKAITRINWPLQAAKNLSKQSQAKKTSPPNGKAGTSQQQQQQTSTDKSGINFYFYKNFNKFIQNLYVQDEKQLKAQSKEAKEQERLLVKKKIDLPTKTSTKAKEDRRTPSRKLKIEDKKIVPTLIQSPVAKTLSAKNSGKNFVNNYVSAGEVKKAKEPETMTFTMPDRKLPNELTKSTKNLRSEALDAPKMSAGNTVSTKINKSSSVKQIPAIEFSKLRLEAGKDKGAVLSSRLHDIFKNS